MKVHGLRNKKSHEVKKKMGSVILSGALMLYCFKKVKVQIITITGIILSVMVRRGIVDDFVTSINYILHCLFIE
jgi:hypothetical protein